MKERKGFISIISLIIMSVLLVMVLYLGYTSKLEYLILTSTIYKTQSYYQSEGKLYRSIYNEKYYLNQLYPNLLDVFRKNNFTITTKRIIIDRNDLEPGDDMEQIRLAFIDENSRIKLKLVAESNLNNVKTKAISFGTIVNEIFEIENSVLALNLIDEKYKKDLEDLLLAIGKNISIYNCHKPDNVFGMESINYNKIVLDKRDANNYEISASRKSMANPYIERFDKKEVLIIARSFEGKPVNLYIGNPENHDKSNGTINLSGVIFVEGNIIISDDFNFKGIIVVKDGQILVDSIKTPKIQGLIIVEELSDLDSFVEKTGIIWGRHMIYKYGTYIPGFFDLKIDLIKGS